MWTARDIPRLDGTTALVTGATAGIGLETAKVLSAQGAHVVIGARNAASGADAARALPGRISVLKLELASLEAVRQAAGDLHERFERLDLLINNAGLWWQPARRTTDGFESQMGVNHLGHFALTGLLLDMLERSPAGRIVTVSSKAAAAGSVTHLDPRNLDGYRPTTAYNASKLANLLFAFELQHRLAASASSTISLAAHPGGARTSLFRDASPGFRVANATIGRLFTQPAHAGALSVLRAATDSQAVGGEYYGPGGPGQFRGAPKRQRAPERACDPATRRRLWAMSEEMTGVTYPLRTDAAH
ncbi:oxidoreductase [Actinoplanes flavus]|uniref:SDR family NAD(P)-dependent oxidoreductase n=1 Tax=Actinoplanes flavus TaxID=2820290 RepID=A0ABS3V055_9ACTN|nr:oxidoreductase [Actinoplanes flavus]MBO3744210.1 SDR family NAD(P)-dependent oxidoreductase [Actinoplanes flavus]